MIMDEEVAENSGSKEMRKDIESRAQSAVRRTVIVYPMNGAFNGIGLDAAIFSRMSSKRRIGSSEGKHSILLDLPPQLLLAYRFGKEVHGPSQDHLKPAAKSIEQAEIGKTAAPGVICETDNYVDVGFGAILAACRRSDQR